MVQRNDIALDVQNVYKAFGKEKKNNWWIGDWLNSKNSNNGSTITIAVDHLTFSVNRGEIFGILGPNGGGKSTLIRLIATLLVPDQGRIKVFDHDVDKEPMIVQRLINRVSVEASFFKKLSPMENLLYGARLYGVDGRRIHADVLTILDRLSIPAKNINRPMEEMSRGMQQKVAIARALLSTPMLLLLDEPTTGLDPRSKKEVQSFIRELQEKQDTTIVLTTHDMAEADLLCDRVAIMDSGRIVALNTPGYLKSMANNTNGHETTLEDVFLDLTGKQLVQETDMPI